MRGLHLLAIAAVLSSSPARADDPQQEKSFEKEVTVKVKLNYLLYLPDDYEKSDKPFPLILFLHGAGESGSNLSNVKKHGPPKLIAAGKTFPFIVVSPQSPGGGWNPEALNGLLDEVESKYRVDKDRVYLTGMSMGGGGTWTLAAALSPEVRGHRAGLRGVSRLRHQDHRLEDQAPAGLGLPRGQRPDRADRPLRGHGQGPERTTART